MLANTATIIIAKNSKGNDLMYTYGTIRCITKPLFGYSPQHSNAVHWFEFHRKKYIFSESQQRHDNVIKENSRK